MPPQEEDPFGAADATTGYEREGKPEGKAESSKTRLAVGLAAIFLTLFLSWLYVTPFDADPAPEGAAPVAVPETKSP
jgi:hypothetical protein